MVDVSDSLEGFMADGQEAGCTRGNEDDRRGTFVRRGTAWETTGCGRGSSDTGDGIVDRTGFDGGRRVWWRAWIGAGL